MRMSCHTSMWPVHPNHIPTRSRTGGAAVTTALARRSTSGMVTGRVAASSLHGGAASGATSATADAGSGRAVSAAGAGDSDVILPLEVEPVPPGFRRALLAPQPGFAERNCYR